VINQQRKKYKTLQV